MWREQRRRGKGKGTFGDPRRTAFKGNEAAKAKGTVGQRGGGVGQETQRSAAGRGAVAHQRGE